MMRFIASLIACVSALFVAGSATAQQNIDIPVAGRPPLPTKDPENLWYLDLSTGGRVTIWLRPDAAPKMVERVKELTRQHFYDGLAFHRVIDGFMAQGGDPKGDGTGGSTLPDMKAEFNFLPHVRGAVSAARTADNEDSANSQFFIVFQPRLPLDQQIYGVRTGDLRHGICRCDRARRAADESDQDPPRLYRVRQSPGLCRAAPAGAADPGPEPDARHGCPRSQGAGPRQGQGARTQGQGEGQITSRRHGPAGIVP